MPFFSIILPVYNAKDYIEKTVESILKQSFTDFELLVVDDGATDGSGDIVRTLSEEHQEIKYFRKKNGGICAARNYGLERATGEYVLFCDHDDIMVGGVLDKVYEILNGRKLDVLKFSYQTYVVFEGKETKNYINRCEAAPDYKEVEALKNDYQQFNNFINTVWNGAYKRTYLRNKGLTFDESIRFGQEDVIFNLHVLENGCRYGMIEDIFYYHYIRYGQSTSRKYNENKLYAILNSVRLEKSFFGSDLSKDVAISMTDKYVRSFFVAIGGNDLQKKELNKWIDVLRVEIPKISLFRCISILISKPKTAVKLLLFKFRFYGLLRNLLRGQ